MEMELLQKLDKGAVESEIAEKFAEVFGVKAQTLEYNDAQSFLTTYLDEKA